MSHSLNSLKEGHIKVKGLGSKLLKGVYIGDYIGDDYGGD